MEYKVLYIVILGLLVSACQPGTPAQEQEAPSETDGLASFVSLDKAQMDLAGITTGVPTLRVVSNYVACTGMVEVPPNNRYLVHAPVAGFVGSVPQLIGDYVRQGSLLTTLSHPSMIEKQRLLLETASQLQTLEKDVERKETLAVQDATSQRVLEQAKAALALAKATFSGLEAELSMMGINTEKLLEGTYQKYIPIYAPVSGYVQQVNGNPGKWVPSDGLLYEIIDVSHQHIELRVFARDLAKIKEKQVISVQVPGMSTELDAHVYRVGQSVDPEQKTAVIHGHLDDEKTTLKPGTYVKARIFLDGTKVPTVPVSAIIQEAGETFVFVVEGDRFHKVPIRTGIQQDGYVELVGFELASDQQLVLDGAYYLNGTMEE